MGRGVVSGLHPGGCFRLAVDEAAFSPPARAAEVARLPSCTSRHVCLVEGARGGVDSSLVAQGRCTVRGNFAFRRCNLDALPSRQGYRSS
jgi:hypothetical protein